MSEEKPKNSWFTLNKLIYIVCFSVIGYVGMNILSCNFMIPGTIEYANSMGKLKNPPSSLCGNSQKDGLNTLLAVAGLLIAYKANSKE